MTAVAARARGLASSLLSAATLGEITAARDGKTFTEALARAGLPCEPTPTAVEALLRARATRDLAALGRHTDALGPLELDEDRRTVRAIVRGLAAGAPPSPRTAGTIPTRRLSARSIAELAAVSSLAQLAEGLADHPLAVALRGLVGKSAGFDLFAVELALARSVAEHARSRDLALRTYLAQVIDTQNAVSALVIAAHRPPGSDRGEDPIDAFLARGQRISRAVFDQAVAGSVDAARARLAEAFDGTPLATAMFAAAPAAVEDAELAWQLHTQIRLRRTEPLGLAPAIHVVLARRDQARRLRATAWRLALGGAP